MATFSRVPIWTTPWAFVRHKMKGVNTRRKRPMSIIKAKMLAATQYQPMKDERSLAERCALSVKSTDTVHEQVSGWKELLKRDARNMLNENQLIAVLHNSGVKAEEFKALRRKLRKQGLELYIVPEIIMIETVENSIFQNMRPLFESKNLYAVCTEPKVKELLKCIKKMPKIVLLGGRVADQLMSVPQMVQYSQLPALPVLQGQLVSVLSTPISRIRLLLQSNQLQLTTNLQQYIKQQSEDEHQ